MDVSTLRSQFALPGVLTFEEFNGLARMQVHTAHAEATIYLQGAHLTAWQPTGHQGVIYTSRQSVYEVGKPIRGGIPVVFPWFAADSKKDRIDGHPGPSHGFARVQDWTIDSVHHAGGEMNLKLSLGPTAMSRSMGFDHFLLRLEFAIGRTLRTTLTVVNQGDQPINLEEAFHTYYAVSDIHETTVSGLEPTSYIDKNDSFTVKPATNAPIVFAKTTDRVYNGTSAACLIHDGAGHRVITLRKMGSNTTVVWNPWNKLPDLGEWEWHSMVAVETVNAGADAIVLAAGKSYVMQTEISVEKVKAKYL